MNKKVKLPRINYFFYNKKLCKKIHISRANDLIVAYNYTDGKVDKYIYSDVRKNGGQAFTTAQAAKLLRRYPQVLRNAIYTGDIKSPQQTYGLDENRNVYKYMWSEEDIMACHDFLKTVHIGRPRKDGEVNTGNLPTAAELRASLRQGTVFYVKVGDDFIPTWKAEKF